MIIRPYIPDDAMAVVAILQQNQQYHDPRIDGPAALDRVAVCPAAVALVAVTGGEITGYIQAVYDGARAMIHLLSVKPACQGRGTGSALAAAVWEELQRRGAPTVSVTVTAASSGFWEKQHFYNLPVFLMLREAE